VNAESIVNQDTVPTEPTHRWADDGGVGTEERQPEPVDPDASIDATGAERPNPPETEMLNPVVPVAETSIEAASNSAGQPLLIDEAEQAFLSRWAEIQVGFVEDPAASVREADLLIDDIGVALLDSFQTRRTELAAYWQHGSPGTEKLRLALRRYRAFIGVMLPT
jgi:hypothetical protein